MTDLSSCALAFALLAFALLACTVNPTNTVFDAKRLIGRAYNEPQVQADKALVPYQIVDKENKPYIKVEIESGKFKTFSPEEISAMVLGRMKETAESYLGGEVTHAVVTVPAYFNDAQRQATKNAATIAGLEVMRIINEPTAAAIAYGLDQKTDDKPVLVFDLGGGTFDVTVLEIDGGVFEVLATNGDTHLGGEDFDQQVMRHFFKMIKAKSGKDISKDKRAVQKLRREVEKAKRTLSSSLETRLEIEGLASGVDFSETLTRAKFEELCLDMFKKTLTPVKKVLADANLDPSDVGQIVLVGGSTRIPKVRQLLSDYFSGRELNTGINADEAVAHGAAVQASLLAGTEDTFELLLLDVAPLSIGMAMAGDVMKHFIRRNTAIPTRVVDTVTTEANNQQSVRIQVYEGERKVSKENNLLGTFLLDGIPPAPRGVPKIEMTFELDANGVLNVQAKDLGTKKANHITITNNKGRLSEEDILRMVRDAEKYAKKDQEVVDRVQARSELEQYLYSLKLSVSDTLADKLSQSDLDTVEEAANDALDWLEDNLEASKADLNARKAEVEAVCNPIVSKFYGQGSGSATNEDDDGDYYDDDFQEDL